MKARAAHNKSVVVFARIRTCMFFEKSHAAHLFLRVSVYSVINQA